MMTEAFADSIEQTLAYYGNGTYNGAHFAFNFYLLMSPDFYIDQIIHSVNMWFSHLSPQYVINWVLGNHDGTRVAIRAGVRNVDAFNMLAAFLPGNVTCEQGFDPKAITNCSTFAQNSRDFERTPFHWDDSPNAGFTNGDHPWLPVSEKYKTNNLKAQNVEGIRSHYNVFKSMVKFRENFKNITEDYLNMIKISDTVLEITRKTDKSQFYYVFNAGNMSETVSLFTNGFSLKVLVTNIDSQFSEGDVIPQTVTLDPNECLVLEGS